MEACDLTIDGARGALAADELTSEALVRACLERIDRVNPIVNALIQVFEDEALDAARESDARRSKGETRGPLDGVPIVLKDNTCLTTGRTTCASEMLREYRSPFSATAALRLEKAGAVILGKTNLDEFAMGSSTEHSCFGPTHNPWRPGRVPGGSSGGSAAAVSARLAPGALGSDTGGSVRQPAGLCGCVGYKPTYGRVSRWGLVAYASSLDQIGTLGRSVVDAALLARAISGHDPRDATSTRIKPIAPLGMEPASIKGRRIAVPIEARHARNHPSVAQAVDQAREALTALGAEVVDGVELTQLEAALDAYYIIAPAEASSNLARFDGVRYGRRAELEPGEDLWALYERSRAEGMGAEVQRRIMLGTYVLSSGYYDAYYRCALKVRRLVANGFARLFSGDEAFDAILMPVTTGPAFEIGALEDDPIRMYLEDIYTVIANLAGLPAIALPARLADDEDGMLPVGVQLIGAMGGDEGLLEVAQALERELAFSARPLEV